MFHISQIEPIFQADLHDITNKWSEVEKLLSPYTVLSYIPRPQSLYPDYGSHLYKLGYTDQEIEHYCPIKAYIECLKKIYESQN